jgi:glycosyltransferase involved in cell wall biosynthesis
MKIGIDARMYGIGQRGIGRYVQQLVGQLLEFCPFGTSPAGRQISPRTTNPHGAENVKFQNDLKICNLQFEICNLNLVLFLSQEGIKACPNAPRVTKILAPWRWYGLAEQIYLPRLIKKAGVDLIHFPHFNVPWFCPVPYVVTIHDVILLHSHRQRSTTLSPLTYWLKYFVWKILLRHTLKKAWQIIVPSQAVKDELTQYMPAVAHKTTVVYEGAPEVANRKLQMHFPLSDWRYAIRDTRYILYVGSAYPHKNLERLLQAFQLLSYKLQAISYKLILVGKQDYFYQRLQKEYVMHQTPPIPPLSIRGGQGELLFPGEVSDQELAVLYQNASLVVLPSLHEGFGLPALEAASYGVPVACADIPVLREVMGENSAFFFNPYDINDMARVMARAFTNEPQRQEKIKIAAKRVKQFSWEKMAKETLEVYQQAIHQALY